MLEQFQPLFNLKGASRKKKEMKRLKKKNKITKDNKRKQANKQTKQNLETYPSFTGLAHHVIFYTLAQD